MIQSWPSLSPDISMALVENRSNLRAIQLPLYCIQAHTFPYLSHWIKCFCV